MENEAEKIISDWEKTSGARFSDFPLSAQQTIRESLSPENLLKMKVVFPFIPHKANPTAVLNFLHGLHQDGVLEKMKTIAPFPEYNARFKLEFQSDYKPPTV